MPERGVAESTLAHREGDGGTTLALAVTEGAGHILRSVNRAFCRLAGAESATLVGRPYGEAFPSAVAAGAVALLDAVYRTGVATDAVGLAHLHASADVASLSYSIWPMLDETGRIDGLVVEVRESASDAAGSGQGQRAGVTMREANEQLLLAALRQQELAEEALRETRQVNAELREAAVARDEAVRALSESEERFRRALEIETVGVLFFDTEGAITGANDAFLRMSGYTREDLVARMLRWDTMTPPEWMPDSLRVIEDLKASGEATPYEKEYIRKDGSRWWALFAPRMLTATEGVEFVLDITDRKGAEEERERALREAREAVRARDEFLSIASHELRTPITGLKGAAQLLERLHKKGTLDADRLLRFTGTVAETGGRLGRLVDDLLDVSRLHTGQMQVRPRPTDLLLLVREAVEQLESETAERSQIVEVGHGPWLVEADPDRIKQVVGNLLDNAAKYSSEGGEINIRLERESTGIVVRVADAGIGLPDGTAESIFEPFGRARNAAERHIPGMGLGLYVCRQIAVAHSGRLWAESAGEGQGTTFSLWLPASPPALEEAATQHA